MKLVHGGDTEGYRALYGREPVDFSANVSVMGLPASVREAIISSLDHADRYPDPLCRELRSAIANVEGVPKGFIMCGNGASDVIYRLVIGRCPKNALVTAPTFAGYEEALDVVKCRVKRHFLYEENIFDITPSILNDIKEDTDMVFICNPNNPTGRTVERALLAKILTKCEQTNTLMVVDECFIEFLQDGDDFSMKSFLQSKNLFIVKAFTKQFAMAGVRLGYALTSNKTLIDAAMKAGQAWSVSYPAQQAGIAALNEREYLDELKKNTEMWKRELIEVLSKEQMKIIGHDANYIFFKTDIENFWDKLANIGVLVRSCENYHGLHENHYRVAVRNSEDINTLKNALAQIGR